MARSLQLLRAKYARLADAYFTMPAGKEKRAAGRKLDLAHEELRKKFRPVRKARCKQHGPGLHLCLCRDCGVLFASLHRGSVSCGEECPGLVARRALWESLRVSPGPPPPAYDTPRLTPFALALISDHEDGQADAVQLAAMWHAADRDRRLSEELTIP